MYEGHENCACQRGPVHPPLWKRAHQRVAWLVGSFYRWHLYRLVQRLAHRFNWHHTRTLGPLAPGGGYLVVCDWCGIRQTVPPKTERIVHAN